eukprot:TRINITY_DN4640_c0_g1_i2.p1 TRINITY_DN4640_c0_g1~~TRINITY_DN4640_c0_g1_i2.p1  ORF type:complete len:304 (+),score=60.65 TRINITY_DN4640_c0_g1_i2:278-1189(+)
MKRFIKFLSTSCFEGSLLSLHSIAAAFLFLLVAIQKYTVQRMKDDKDYKTYADIHRNVGYICLIVIPTMALGGFLLGGYSSFENFSYFSVVFAAPFVFWTLGIYWTAQKYSSSMISAHRLLGNMLLKGCVAVPLARVFGSLLQSRGDWDDEVAFYTGIKLASLLIAIWELTEMYYWYIRFKSLRSHVKPASQDTQFDANAYIDQKIKTNKVMVFSKSYCIYCHRVKTLFEEHNVPFESIELDLWEHGPIVHQALIAKTNLKTVPNVFVGGKHVGGCDATQLALKNGKLKTMLVEAGITNTKLQ